MALNEAQRQEYLEVMGIQSYFPRYQLPGAKPSEQSVWSESMLATKPVADTAPLAPVAELQQTPDRQGMDAAQLEPEVAPVSITQAPEAKAVPQQTLRQMLAQAEGEMKAPAQTDDSNLHDNNLHESKVSEAAPSVDNSTNNEQTEDVRFQLAVFRLNEKTCVLNQMPYFGVSQHLLPEQKALFNKICQSLKLAQAPIRFDEITPFRWPFSDGGNLDNTATAARASLTAYLQQQHSVQAFDTLIVMGDMVSSYCVTEDAGNNDLPWQVVSTRSLDEMLKVWQFKRDAWRQLQAYYFTKG